MGRIASVLSFARRVLNGAPVADVKANPGGGQNLTAPHFAPAGDDSPPLPGDYGLLVSLPRTGGWAVVGYSDQSNAGTASPGERRLYSRTAGGAVAAEVHLANDGGVTLSNDQASVEMAASGTIALANSSGSIEIGADGTVTINGVTIDTSGNITTTGEVTGGVVPVTLTGHVHPGVVSGPSSTGGPVG